MRRLRTIIIILAVFAAYSWEHRLFFMNYNVDANLFNVVIYRFLSPQCVIGIITIFMLFDIVSNYVFYFGSMFVYRHKNVIGSFRKMFYEYMCMLAIVNIGMLVIDIGYVLLINGDRITAEQVRIHILSFVVVDLICVLFMQGLLLLISVIKDKKVSLLILTLICIYVAFAPEILPYMRKWYPTDKLILLLIDMREYTKEILRLGLLNLAMFAAVEVAMWKKDF